MLDMRALQAQDLRGLSSDALAVAAQQMLQHIAEQSKCLQSQAQAIKFKDAKIESITFELARLKAWKFGARTEAMNAQQRALGRCQGSCRKLFDSQAADPAGSFCSFTVCGLRCTSVIGAQLRALPDQRLA